MRLYAPVYYIPSMHILKSIEENDVLYIDYSYYHLILYNKPLETKKLLFLEKNNL